MIGWRDTEDIAIALSENHPALDPPLPDAVSVHRVPTDWSYDRLLEQIFWADRVVTW